MGFVHKSHNALEGAKWIGVSYVLSLAAGWLTRKLVNGKISSDDKAALAVLLVTVLTLVIVLCTVGIRRWKTGALGPAEKRVMVISLIIYLLMFTIGWFVNIG